MTDIAALASPAAHSFRPADAEALWQRISAPQSTVGKARRLGEALVHAGHLTTSKLWQGLQAQRLERESGKRRPIGQILVEQGALTQEQLREVIANWLGEYTVHPGDLNPEAAALALVPRAMAERESVLPLMVRGDTLVLLLADPGRRVLIDELRFLTQRRLIALQAASGTLLPAIRKAYRIPGAESRDGPAAVPAERATTLQGLVSSLGNAESDDADAEQADVTSSESDALIQIINAVIEQAIKHRASDIHVEAEYAPKKLRIRLRIDGDLTTFLELPARCHVAMVARIKIMAGMDISERRKAQDGKIDFARFGGSPVELRVVTVPTSNGLEDVVLRLLSGALALECIGLSQANLLALRSVAQKHHGLVLVCGPIGSGKTSTLHSLLLDISGTGRKVWTVEDPIEITQEDLRQIQINPRQGWTLASALRALLRADPDVIMIGEMRDEEMMRLTLEAALTDCLVLTTLPTNARPESIARQLGQLEIRINLFSFPDLPLAILVQRLVRRLCPACSVAQVADQGTLMELAAQYLESTGGNTLETRTAQIGYWRQQYGGAQGELRLWRRTGCIECHGHGYRGRLGIHGLMVRDESPGYTAPDTRALYQDGIEKALQGLTDMAQVQAHLR